MEGVTRIGVSLEPELLKEFDSSITKKGYVSRSEAIRDLVRDSISESESKYSEEYLAGTMVIVYDRTATNIAQKMTDTIENHNSNILASFRTYLGKDRAMMVLMSGGKLNDLKSLSNDLSTIKGVMRNKLTFVSPADANFHYIGHRV